MHKNYAYASMAIPAPRTPRRRPDWIKRPPALLLGGDVAEAAGGEGMTAEVGVVVGRAAVELC